MEYPGSKLTRPIRLTILIAFIAAFFIISPLVIIISAGFRFDTKNGLLRETGSLSVDITPETAQVYLDGIKIDQKIPIRLNNITPHKYTLRLSAPGYYEWEKVIEINKNQTTYIKGLIMIKKSKPEKISELKPTEISVSPNGKYAATAVIKENEVEVNVNDLEKNIIIKSLVLENIDGVDFTWSDVSSFLVITNKSRPFKDLLVINPASQNSVKNLVSGEIKSIDKYIWSKDIEPKLYFESKNKIYSYLARLDQTSFVTANIFQDWFIDNGLLWTINFNTSSGFLFINSDSLGFENLFYQFQNTTDFPSSTLRKLTIESVKNNTVILKNQEQNKYYIINNQQVYTINGEQILYSRFNDWLLAWTPWELWTYSEGDEPYLLNRSGDELMGVLPLDEHNTLALIWNNNVTVLHPYFLTQRTVIDESIYTLSADTVARTIYFSNSNGFWKLDY